MDLAGDETQKVFDKVLANLARSAPPIPGFRRTKGGTCVRIIYPTIYLSTQRFVFFAAWFSNFGKLSIENSNSNLLHVLSCLQGKHPRYGYFHFLFFLLKLVNKCLISLEICILFLHCFTSLVFHFWRAR